MFTRFLVHPPGLIVMMMCSFGLALVAYFAPRLLQAICAIPTIYD